MLTVNLFITMKIKKCHVPIGGTIENFEIYPTQQKIKLNNAKEIED